MRRVDGGGFLSHYPAASTSAKGMPYMVVLGNQSCGLASKNHELRVGVWGEVLKHYWVQMFSGDSVKLSVRHYFARSR